MNAPTHNYPQRIQETERDIAQAFKALRALHTSLDRKAIRLLQQKIKHLYKELADLRYKAACATL